MRAFAYNHCLLLFLLVSCMKNNHAKFSHHALLIKTCDIPRENDDTNDERYIVWTIYRSFSAIYRSFILNGKTIISLKNYRSFFLNGIMVLLNNSIITIWWMVRKPGVGYQFADRLFYNFNVLFFLKKESFSVILFIMFLLNVYNLFLSLFSFKNDYWIKNVLVCKLLLFFQSAIFNLSLCFLSKKKNL